MRSFVQIKHPGKVSGDAPPLPPHGLRQPPSLPPCPRVLLLGTGMLCCKRCFPSPFGEHSGPSRLDGAPRVKWLVWAAVAVGTGLHPPPIPPGGGRQLEVPTVGCCKS